MRGLLIWIGVFVGGLTPASAYELRVENSSGGVHVRTLISGAPGVRWTVEGRKAGPDDVQIVEDEKGLRVSPSTADDRKVDIEIDVPFNVPVQIHTDSGPIKYEGFPIRLSAVTRTGAVAIQAPWNATRFLMLADKEPKRVETPQDLKFKGRKSDRIEGVSWVMTGPRGEDDVGFGSVQVRADQAQSLTLLDEPIPAGSPVKMTWQAEEVAAALLQEAKRNRSSRVGAQSPDASPATTALVAEEEESGADFSFDVRMVDLDVAVYDANGRPLPNLEASDFRVYEEGELQEVSTVETGEEPFNLVVLLDLSASTQRNREQMKEIARGFLSIARPNDRVALHALANNWFLILSNLTRDREALEAQVEALPELTGGSPVYDSILMSYGEELDELPNQRNALIVITDGRDNRFDSVGLASKVGIRRLRQAAEAMNALIYPIYLGPSEEEVLSSGRHAKAYQQLREIAAASGGRIFHADSIDEAGDVYAQVAEELRSVYSLAYYPQNQDFDGAFRQVRVEVDRPGAVVRTRAGYFAQ